MTTERKLGVSIQREVPTKLYPFGRFFRGFARNPAVRELFGARTAEVLRRQKVEFFSSRFGYMGTSDVDGHILVSTHHLKRSDFRTVYLDLIHELCHVKQFRDGRRLFYPRLRYMEAPSEVEAYAFTVKEGLRIGMTNAQLVEYLKVEWVSRAEYMGLARRLGLLSRRSRPHRSGRRRGR